MARAREKLKAAEVKVRSKSTAPLAMVRHYSTAAGSGLVDGRTEALKALDKIGTITPGSGTSDTDLWQAARVLRNWGVDDMDAVNEMEARYPGFPAGRVARKVRDAYRAEGLHGCWLRAAEEEAGAGASLEEYFSVDDGVTEFDLEGGGIETAENAHVSERCSTQQSSTVNAENVPSCVGRLSPGNDVPDNNRPLDRLKRTTPTLWVDSDPARFTEVTARFLPGLPSFSGLRKLEVVKAPPGTGKNERLTAAWSELEARGGRGACVSYRRSLTRANTTRWSSQGSKRRNYMDCTAPITDDIIDICVNSLPSLAYPVTMEEESEDVTVWDEWQQLLRHVFSAGSEDDLCELWAAMETRFRRSKVNIIQDAHMSILGIHAAHLLLGWETPDDADEHLLISRWKGEPKPIVQWEEEDSEVAFHRAFLEAVNQTVWDVGEEVWVKDFYLTTSATHAEAVYQEVTATLVDSEFVLLVTADTIRDDLPGVQEAIADPRKFSAYRVVIGSPAIFTGLSIEEKHWRGWNHFRASVGQDQVHTSEDCHQALSRLRDPLEVNVWAEGRACFPEINSEKILEDLQIRGEETKTNKFIVGAYSEIVGGPRTELAYAPESLTLLTVKAGIMAHEARTGGQLGDRRVKDKAGNLVEVVPGTLWRFLEAANCKLKPARNKSLTPAEKKAIRKSLHDSKVVAEAVHRQAVLTAEILPIKKAQQLKKHPSPPPGTGASLEATFATEFYGKQLSDELLKRDNRTRNRGRVKQFAHVVAIEQKGNEGRKAVAAKDAAAVNRSTLALSAKAYGPAKRIVLLLEHLFHLPNLVEAAKTGQVIHIPQAVALPEHLKSDLYRWLKIKVTPANLGQPVRLLSSLLSKLGLELAPQRITNPSGTRGRVYRIDRESMDRMLEDGGAYYSKLFTSPAAPIGTHTPVDVAALVAELLDDCW